MKKIIFTLSLGMFGLLRSNAQTTQVVDLSTGVVNGSTAFIGAGTADDTWSMMAPAGIGNNAYSTSFSSWTAEGHSRWISPFVTISGVAEADGVATDYVYRTTFMSTGSGCVSNAVLSLIKYGGDNLVKSITVNGTSHPLSAGFGTLATATITLANSEIIPGALNTITVTVQNDLSFGAVSCTGLLIYGNLTITYPGDPGLTPSFTGSTQFCKGAPLTFVGSDGPSTATNTFWEVTTADASGNVIPGYTWNHWYNGVPGTYSFPDSVKDALPCNSYYNIKLAVQNACVGWIQTVKTIHINCLPIAEAGEDDTICSGSCANIGESIRGTGISYSWATNQSGSNVIVGHTQTLTVCPTTTTTYTITATNSSGCSSTDAVTVYVVHNDPSFSLYVNTALTSYFTVTLYANNIYGYSDPGFYYEFEISELNSGSAALYTDTGTDAWWFYPNNTFKGFDATPYPLGGNYTQTAWWAPAPNDGRFLYGHTYKITRYTKNAACNTYVPYYIVITPAPHMLMQNGSQKMEVLEGKDADDFIARMATTSVENTGNELSVYPNPGNGIFTISTTNLTGGIMEVYDVRGTKIQSVEIKNTDTYSLDLSNYAKGIYMIKMNVNNRVITKKIILQ